MAAIEGEHVRRLVWTGSAAASLILATCLPLAAWQDEFKPLPVEQSLRGWQVDPAAVRRVGIQDGSLALEGDSRWVVTDAAYADFVLRFEANAQPGAQGGVLIRAAKGTAAFSGYEVTIADKQRRAGRLLRWLPSTVSALLPSQTLLPAGTGWHSFEIVCRENVITVAIDGATVLKARGLLQNIGQIGFRAHSGRLAIRHVQLAEIPIPEAEVPPGVLKADLPGVVLPRLTKSERPRYTSRALELGAQGTVWIACVVRHDGKLTDLRVVRSVMPELDAEALKAVRRWRFEPGTSAGKPVDVQVTIEMSFTLK